METQMSSALSRRSFLRIGALVAPGIVLLAGGALSATRGSGTVLAQATCGSTEPQTEGPYFKPSSPERTSLVTDGMGGTPLLLTGTVMSLQCQPIAGALLDFWQANDRGQYDNSGFTLRGHQYTDEQGSFRLETIVPGLYPGRTRHIHVKVQAPNSQILTTQLYFPGEAGNARDGIFSSALLMNINDGAQGSEGTFSFVVNG